MDCIIYLAKSKALISCAVTAQLICAFVFAYAKISFSHVAAYFIVILMLQSHDNPLKNEFRKANTLTLVLMK